METRFSITIKQALISLGLVALLTVGLTLGIFYLGQLSVSPQLDDDRHSTVLDSVTPTLPRAMTATPIDKSVEIHTFTDEFLTQVLQEQIGGTGYEIPISVQQVTLGDGQITISGELDYMGYSGGLSISAEPYIDRGKLRFYLVSVALDGQSLPEVFNPTMEAQIDAIFEQLLDGYDVEAVEVEDGLMTVTLSAW